jgi:hypothetical protein
MPPGTASILTASTSSHRPARQQPTPGRHERRREGDGRSDVSLLPAGEKAMDRQRLSGAFFCQRGISHGSASQSNCNGDLSRIRARHQVYDPPARKIAATRSGTAQSVTYALHNGTYPGQATVNGEATSGTLSQAGPGASPELRAAGVGPVCPQGHAAFPGAGDHRQHRLHPPGLQGVAIPAP